MKDIKILPLSKPFVDESPLSTGGAGFDAGISPSTDITEYSQDDTRLKKEDNGDAARDGTPLPESGSSATNSVTAETVVHSSLASGVKGKSNNVPSISSPAYASFDVAARRSASQLRAVRRAAESRAAGMSQLAGMSDPFVSAGNSLFDYSPHGAGNGQSLSADVPEFVPSRPLAAGNASLWGLNATSVPDIVTSPTYSGRASLPSSDVTLSQRSSNDSASPSFVEPIGSGRRAPNNASTSAPSHLGLPFSTDVNDQSRFVTILRVDPSQLFTGQFHAAFAVENGFPRTAGVAHDQQNGHVNLYLAFDDFREAELALRVARKMSVAWEARLSSQHEWLMVAPADKLSRPVSKFEGQVIVRTRPYATSQREDTVTRRDIVYSHLYRFGAIKSFGTLETGQPDVFAFRAEYFRVSSATFAIDESSKHAAGYRYKASRFDCLIWVEQYTPNSHRSVAVFDPFTTKYTIESVAGFQRRPDLSSALDRLSIGGRSISDATVSTPFRSSDINAWSPTGRTCLEEQTYTPMTGPRESAYREPPSTSRSSGPRNRRENNSGVSNMVFPDRIRSGLDVRTTIMLRNIPNKLDFTALRELLNETSIGSYDFVYLRIDFQNNCNVGYAFINFADPTYIIDFVESVAGRRWNRFNSDKVAEVSYATIQGRDCLVQKFRNSSVMCEYPKFRPKLFYAIGHPDVVAGRARLGDEEPFPAPDNQSKLRRSMDNAEHVGLFAPRQGQYSRDEQRRRRSRFDRGNPYATIEEGLDLEDYQRNGRLPCAFLTDFTPSRRPSGPSGIGLGLSGGPFNDHNSGSGNDLFSNNDYGFDSKSQIYSGPTPPMSREISRDSTDYS